MTKKSNCAPSSDHRPSADELESLTPVQRQFAAVLGDLLAERWLVEQREFETAPPTVLPRRSTNQATCSDRNSPAK